MNRFWTTVTIIILILVFVAYMVFDLVFKKENIQVLPVSASDTVIADQWFVQRSFDPGKGKINALAISQEGNIILAGEPNILFYDNDLNLLWEFKTESHVTAIAVSADKMVFAALTNKIIVLSFKGEMMDEWGPFDDKDLITSIAANDTYVAYADAAGKAVIILSKDGVLKNIIGKSESEFIIPSPYFDVALSSDNTLYIANTGKRRIERRSIEGKLIDFFGEEGLAPEAFCGCCNPAHFALLPDGYVTAEKGINRIKKLDKEGKFVEFISSDNNFLPPIPLDIATANDGQTIYGVYPQNSRLYVFKRK